MRKPHPVVAAAAAAGYRCREGGEEKKRKTGTREDRASVLVTFMQKFFTC